MTMKTNNTIYKRKMSAEELEEHLKLGTRARTFTDRKKERSRRACRGRDWH